MAKIIFDELNLHRCSKIKLERGMRVAVAAILLAVSQQSLADEPLFSMLPGKDNPSGIALMETKREAAKSYFLSPGYNKIRNDDISWVEPYLCTFNALAKERGFGYWAFVTPADRSEIFVVGFLKSRTEDPKEILGGDYNEREGKEVISVAEVSKNCTPEPFPEGGNSPLPETELVLRPGARLEVMSVGGPVAVVAGQKIMRRYEWGSDCTLDVAMIARPKRWQADLGIFGWSSKKGYVCKGIAHAVGMEGQLHFNDGESAEEWLHYNGQTHLEKTSLVWANNGLVAEVSFGDGAVDMHITQLCINGQPLRNGQDVVAYYHHDTRSAPIQATDKQGKLVWAATYSVFGQAALTLTPSPDNPSITSNLRLPGQYQDDETGLHYNGRRYYDPGIGRYITQDPLGGGGGLNRYLYADGDPLNRIDPTGEFAFLIPLGMAAGELAAAYGTCMASCMAFETALLPLKNECANWGGMVKDCAIGCAFGAGIGAAVKGGLWAKRANDARKAKKAAEAQRAKAAVQEAEAAVCTIPGNSFPTETLVHVKPAQADPADAQAGRTVLKPIGELKPGDEVLAFGEWKEKGTNPDRDARLSYEKVLDIYGSHKRQTLVHLTLDNGETLTATEGHPFHTPEGWRDAVMLKKGGQLLLKGEGDSEERLATLVEVRTESRTLPVLNLEVANAHTFFVGTDGVGVHNARGCGNPAVREAIEAGKRAHKTYKDTLGYVERTLKNGKRPDSVDYINNIVRELKPDTPSGIKKGTKQLAEYVKQLEAETGKKWTGYLDLYRAKK